MTIHSSFADVWMGHRIASCNATQSTAFYWQVDNQANNSGSQCGSWWPVKCYHSSQCRSLATIRLLQLAASEAMA
jgi:hypothetical protein